MTRLPARSPSIFAQKSGGRESAALMKNVPSMPASLEEALSCLEDDHGFLMKGDVFTEELLETFIDYKRKNEADAIRLRPHPYEFALYYDV